MPLASEHLQRRTRLSDPALRRALQAAVKRRVRGAEAEDIVQATLADVLSAAEVPDDSEEFRRFVFGVARHKVFDHFRRAERELPEDHAPIAVQSEPPLTARDILRWAEEELPDSDSKHTLEWMLREGDGEKLEHIARDANLPAPRVRQRVSRLRRFLRERWAAELLVAGLSVCVLAGIAWYLYSRGQRPDDVAKPEPVSPERTSEEGREIRRLALERCRTGNAGDCLRQLDRAKRLDPAGDSAPAVVAARRSAKLRLAPVPSAVPSPVPVPSAAPSPSTTPAPTSFDSMPAPRTPTTPARPRRVPTPNPSDISGEQSGQK